MSVEMFAGGMVLLPPSVPTKIIWKCIQVPFTVTLHFAIYDSFLSIPLISVYPVSISKRGEYTFETESDAMKKKNTQIEPQRDGRIQCLLLKAMISYQQPNA